MRREEEMSQAAHRPRLAWAEGNPKTVIIMSHLDLPGLPADQVIDPRAMESMKRTACFADFITDCLDGMGFYFDGLAELAGIVEMKSKTVAEFRQRLGGTGSLMGNAIRQPVPPNDSAAPLYPANRNAFYRDRDAILNTMELPGENLTFSLATARRVTIKVWGDAGAAEAWLSALAQDRLQPERPFTMEELLKVCEQHQIQMAVLLSAPTKVAASYRLFETSPLQPWGLSMDSTPASGKEEARQHGGEGAWGLD